MSNAQRRLVLIDGENLTYGLRTLLAEPIGDKFGRENEKAPRSVLNGFAFRALIEELLEDQLPIQIIWFGARLRQYDQNEQILAKSKAAIALQAGFMNMLQKQQIQFVKVGNLRAREMEVCKECEHIEWNLIEKGVDVGLAIRMIAEANSDTELVIISADTDLLPAFKMAKKMGARLMHVGYEYRPIAALSMNADSTRIITRPMAKKYKELTPEGI